MVEFGLLLTPGPDKGWPLTQWMDHLESSVVPLAGKFNSLWMSDHMFWEDVPTFEAWTVLSYIAARWPQYKVVPSVLAQGYRNPALLAKMAATLQILSGGRFVMGIGAGWKEDEYEAYGYLFPSPKVRLEQLEDTLEIMKRLWTEAGPVTYFGKHYHVVDAIFEPKPNPAPPIVVGGGGKTTKLLAARHADMWNLSDCTIETYTDHLIVLNQHLEMLRRDPKTLRLSWLGRLSVGKTEAEARRRALTFGYTHYKGWTLEKAFVGTPQQVVDKIGPFIEAGVDTFVFEIVGLPDPDVIGMVLEDVLPRISG